MRREPQLKWAKAHPDIVSKLHRKYNQKYKDLAFALLGNKCSNPNCPIPQEKMDIRCLQIDHINNDGNRANREGGRHGGYYHNVVRSIEKGEHKYQLLCAYCNWLKRYK